MGTLEQKPIAWAFETELQLVLHEDEYIKSQKEREGRKQPWTERDPGMSCHESSIEYGKGSSSALPETNTKDVCAGAACGPGPACCEFGLTPKLQVLTTSRDLACLTSAARGEWNPLGGKQELTGFMPYFAHLLESRLTETSLPQHLAAIKPPLNSRDFKAN